MENEDEFGTGYLKKFKKFKLFVSNKEKSPSAREKISKIENGILKRNAAQLPQIGKDENRNIRLSNGCAIGCLALASFFAITCLFGENLGKKVFAALAGTFVAGEGAFAVTGLIYHIKLRIDPSLKKTQDEIERIKKEFAEFGDNEEYLKAFMAINQLDEKSIEDEGNDKLLTSPLGRWAKLVEIFPELENT